MNDCSYIKLLTLISTRKHCEPSNDKWIRENYWRIKNVPWVCIYDQLCAMAQTLGTHFADSILLLDEYRILMYLLPEIYILKFCIHSKSNHPEGKTVFEHVIAALRCNQVEDFLFNFAILFHDIGKTISFTKQDICINNEIQIKFRYFGHAEKGNNVLNLMNTRFHFPPYIYTALSFAISNHMNFHNVLEFKNRKIYALLNNPHFPVLYNVCYCDDRCRLHLFDPSHWKKVNERLSFIINFFHTSLSIPYNNPLRKIITGKRIMNVVPDIVHGPLIGRCIEENLDISDADKIDFIIKEIAQ